MKFSTESKIKFILFSIVIILIWIFGNKPEGDFAFIKYMLICYVLYIGYIQHKNRKKDPIKHQVQQKHTTIVSTYITEVKYVEKGGIAGSILGGHFFGLLGGIIGYSLFSEETPKYVYFNVTYLDNHSEIIKTKYNSYKYKKFMKYCINEV